MALITQKEFSRKEADVWGVQNLISCRFGELSSGQRQRVLLAASFFKQEERAWLLLDEPLSFLETQYGFLLEEQIDLFLREKGGMILSTHDLVWATRQMGRSVPVIVHLFLKII